MALRLNWRLKAVLPVLAVLLNGLLLFLLVTIALGIEERKSVMVVAVLGAICICTVLVMTLGFIVHRPMIELQEKIERVRDGNLNVTVSFAKRDDDIGDLGRNFNDMVQQLREAARRSSASIGHRSPAPNTWQRWVNSRRGWRTRSAIRWPE